MSATDIHRTIDAIWRIESTKIIARCTRIVRDVGVAEELAQDALVAALEQWPAGGMPTNPGAWLMAAAKNRAVDLVRRNQLVESKQESLSLHLSAEVGGGEIDPGVDEDVGDDLLRLMFTTCHPVLSTESRVALTLRLLGGLTTDEIARAYLTPEPTIAQRIVRAKRTLAEHRADFTAPSRRELLGRLPAVLEVIYLIFNEGYAATAGDDWLRPALCEDALRLGRVLAALLPAEAEVHGLVALMEIQASRLRARVDASGEPILLLDQNRAHWDRLLITRGLKALAKAEQFSPERGPYTVQAAIAACHARALTADATDWRRIAELYVELMELVPSPIVALNYAVAVSMTEGPAAGLELVDELVGEASLARYHLLPSVRGDLLFKLARYEEAADEFDKAASLTQNARERKLLVSRAAESRKLAGE